MFDIKACRMTSLDWFSDGFFKFKTSKDRDHSVSDPAKSGLVFIRLSPVWSLVFFPVFETGPCTTQLFWQSSLGILRSLW